MPLTSPLSVQHAVVSPGVRLEFVDTGNPDGLPVVFLHGVTDSWRSFGPLMALLPASIRRIAVSQRGHGDSSRPDAGYRIEDMAQDLDALLDALDLPAAVIVGHSMGSFVAQRFAADHPDRTLGLVLMGSAPSMVGNALVQEMAAALETMTDPMDPAFASEFQTGTLVNPVDPEFFEMAVTESLKVPVRVWRDVFRGFLELDHTALLRRIQAQTLIVWGTRDAIFNNAEQAVLHEEIPQGRRLTYAGGSHAFHWEDPATFAADLAGFCRSVAPVPA